MTDKTHDGGPAFPFIKDSHEGSGVRSTGMTLRDYFAAAALTGLLANDAAAWKGAALNAYRVADEMIQVSGHAGTR